MTDETRPGEAARLDCRRLGAAAAALSLVGFGLLAVGVGVDPDRAWLSYLMAFVFVFSISVGGLVLLLIGYAASSRWMAVVRRLIESLALPVPLLALLFVPVLFGLDRLYPWSAPPPHASHEELAILAHREPFMNPSFFAVRAAIYFVIFAVATALPRAWSLRRDAGRRRAADDDPLRRERTFASAMLPPVGLAFTFASFDWVMSLEPIWYSSIFGIYLFAGGFVAAIGLVAIQAAGALERQETGGPITPHHFHALGRLLFAFAIFWAYGAFFQALLIRIADRPDEITFYLERTAGAWGVLVWILIVGHFLLPFLFLLPRRIKFRPRAVAAAGGWLALMHLVDVYWLVIPAHVQGAWVFHWLDLAALAAVVGGALAFAAWRQHGRPAVPTRDPYLAAGAAYRSRL